MTRKTRQVMVGIVIAGLGCMTRSAAAEDAEQDALEHVRSLNPSILALIAAGNQQSTTFRRLVETVNASDGIVYVDDGRCKGVARTCFSITTSTAAHRFFRASIDMHKADWDVIGSIAHELRHTIEVLADRTVTTNERARLFYVDLGAPGGTFEPFETAAAVAAGEAVRAELKKYRASVQRNPE